MKGTHQRGMSLLELMIAMVIGVFIIGGAFTVHLTANTARHTNDIVARMQENGRYALRAIKNDLRLAGYWGLTRELGLINGFKGSPTELGPISDDCEDRWYVDLRNAVLASNDENPYSTTCLPAGEYLDGTDVLVVRHAATGATAAPQAGVVYLRTDRGGGEIFEGPTLPSTTYAPTVENHRLVTHLYYVRPYTFTAGDNIPSLRRLVLAADGTGPVISDQEVIPGVEDLQVQYGIDDTGDGAINRYVHADAALGGAEILAVRLWIMTRAQEAEGDLEDKKTYTYASKSVTYDDEFRRLLVTSTIQLRNLVPVPTL